MIFLLSLVFACQLIILRTAFSIKNLSSPIYVVLYFYLFTGIVGYTLYSLFPDFASFGYTSLEILLDPKELLLTLQYFLLSINTILLGSLVFLTIIRHDKSRSKKYVASSFASRSSFNFHSKLVKTIPEKPKNLSKPLTMKLKPGILIFLCSIPTILLIIGVGPEKIMLKDAYMEVDNRFLLSIANILIMPALLVLGFNLANNLSLFKRFVCLLLIFIDFVVFFSSATRSLALLPILVTFGYWFNSKRKKLTGIFLAIISISLFSPFFYLSLSFRGQAQHGFLPYLEYVLESPNVIFTSPLGIISNLLFAFPLTGEVMKQRLSGDFPIDYLLISLNPLPGALAGWYSINTKLGLNYATPFNTLGEMYIYGDAISFGLFFALGIILIFITIVFQKNLEMGRFVYALVLFVLVLSFSFGSLQYNLRSTTRILYLAFVLSGFFYKKPRILKE